MDAPLPDRSPDDVGRLRLAVLRVARRLRQNTSGITQSQLSALASVQRDGPIAISALAEIENVRPPSVSRIVAALEGEGWVARVADPADGRVALVAITTAGNRQLAALRADRDAWLAQRLDRLDAADVEALLGAVGALERLLAEGDRPSAADASGPTPRP